MSPDIAASGRRRASCIAGVRRVPERCRAPTPSACCRSSRAASPARSTASCSSRPRTAARWRSPSSPMADGGSVVLVEDITDRKMAEAKINQLARYDALTGLPNRAFFRDQMDAARRRPAAPRSVRHPLHRPRRVQAGQRHARPSLRRRAAVRRRRPPARGRARAPTSSPASAATSSSSCSIPLGHPKEAAALAERIVAALAEPYEISGHEVVIGASIGIALAPRDGSDADLLLKNADMALYRAKSDGRRRLALLRARHGRDGAGAPQPAARPAQRARHQRASRSTTSRCSTCTPSGSRPARRCCAGRIRCAA